MVTGVFKSEDFAYFLEEHPRFHKILNDEVKIKKIEFYKNKLHLGKPRHEVESMLDPHSLKQ